jgi:hypothetical protein
MTNLKEINFGLNQYCGPAVLSALTGRSTDECASVIMSITGRAEVRAVEIGHLMTAFKKLRFDVNKVDTIGRTLYGTLIRLSDMDGFYVVMVPKHVVAIEVTNHQVYLVDNHSKNPLPANSSARLMQRVEQVYKVSPKAEPIFIRTEIEIKNLGCMIRIVATDRYENADDNITRHLGQFMFKSEDELKQIIKSLTATSEASR